MNADNLYDNILMFAWLKATESAFYFWRAAHNCRELKNKIYFLYLALKKKQQVTCIENIARDLHTELPSFNEYNTDGSLLHSYTVPGCQQSLEQIHASTLANAKREIEFCKLQKVLCKDKSHQAVLESLISLAGEFSGEVQTAFTKCATQADSPRELSSVGFVCEE